MPYRYFIQLAFDGTDFSGWQVQPNSATVQSEIEKALGLIIRHSTSMNGCGRTDAGVHSRVFFAHFDLEEPIQNPDNLVFKLNRFLPSSIAIISILPVKVGIHARFSATEREYTYTIARKKDPFLTAFSYYFSKELDVELMNSGCNMLLEYTDFECFSKVKTQVANFRCHLTYAKWELKGDALVFTIRADRFLRNMVRSIVGTLLELGMNRISILDLKQILLSRDRRKAGRSVPAKGLMLSDIRYPEDCFVKEAEWFSIENLDEIILKGRSDSNDNQSFDWESD
jgi:tRNA pseudouridine38-40 synthase